MNLEYIQLGKTLLNIKDISSIDCDEYCAHWIMKIAMISGGEFEFKFDTEEQVNDAIDKIKEQLQIYKDYTKEL